MALDLLFAAGVGARGLSIRDCPASERPRERLERLGAGALSTVELLTILIGTGTRRASADQVARAVLATYPRLRRLALRPIHDLAAVEGVGAATAARLAATFELAAAVES